MDNLEIVLAIRNPCNYSCYYCVADKNYQQYENFDLKKINDFYNSLNFFTVTNFECGAGEPSLHPQIKDIISICVSKGMVSIPTNFALSADKWIKKEDSKRVQLRVALHSQTEVNIDFFIDKIKKAQDLGIYVSIIFVAHPNRFKKIKFYKDLFLSLNIDFQCVAFIGEWKNKIYPNSYTEEEKELVGNFSSWDQKLRADMFCRNFYGIPCLGGSSLIYIDPQGGIRKCLYDVTSNLTELDNEIKPCNLNGICGCGLYLEELNTQRTEFWNDWRKMAGFPLLPCSSISDSNLYLESKEKYFNLMKKYDKMDLNHEQTD